MNELERVLASEALNRLQTSYVRCTTNADWPALVQLFLPDARFSEHIVGGAPGVWLSGRDSIQRHLADAANDAPPLTQLFAREVDVVSSTQARSLWVMEGRIELAATALAGHASEKPRGLWAPGDWREHHPPVAGSAHAGGKLSHAYDHYHAVHQKWQGQWFIAAMKRFRVGLEVPC
jgi:hypothetical protein